MPPAAAGRIHGDDFNFAELIAGDAQGYPTRCSVFDAIAPAAAAALAALVAVTAPDSTPSSAPPSRYRGTSSARRRGSTSRVSCSWRGSTGGRSISGWSADSRGSSFCITSSCSSSPTRLASVNLTLHARGCARCLLHGIDA